MSFLKINLTLISGINPRFCSIVKVLKEERDDPEEVTNGV